MFVKKCESKSLVPKSKNLLLIYSYWKVFKMMMNFFRLKMVKIFLKNVSIWFKMITKFVTSSLRPFFAYVRFMVINYNINLMFKKVIINWKIIAWIKISKMVIKCCNDWIYIWNIMYAWDIIKQQSSYINNCLQNINAVKPVLFST